MYRAVCGRVENTLQGLPPPYMLNRPVMCLITSSEQRHPAKAPNFSVNWITGEESVEIVSNNTGKPEVGISRICKRVLGDKFASIFGKLSSITGIEDKVPYHYCDAKEVPSYKVCLKRVSSIQHKIQILGFKTQFIPSFHQSTFGLLG